jgi:hypothetical protein
MIIITLKCHKKTYLRKLIVFTHIQHFFVPRCVLHLNRKQGNFEVYPKLNKISITYPINYHKLPCVHLELIGKKDSFEILLNYDMFIPLNQ